MSMLLDVIVISGQAKVTQSARTGSDELGLDPMSLNETDVFIS